MSLSHDTLKALHDAATPGPWRTQKPSMYPDDNGLCIIGLRLHENGEPMETPTNGLVAVATQTPVEVDEGDSTRAEANAALLTALRNAVPEILTLIAERDAMRWQPIETAPKDGTTIDVWRDGSRETVYWGLPPHECGEMGSYCDSDWHGITEPGWICSTFGEFVGGKHDPFTHWMPLPAAPALGGNHHGS